MNAKLSEFWKALVVLATDVWHWLYPHAIFEKEPMEFHFAKVRTPKLRYDIRKNFLNFSIKSKDDGFKYCFFILMLVLLFVMPSLTRNVGVSPREWQQNEYSEAVYRHYTADDDTYKTLPQYVTKGQAADVLLVSVCKALKVKDVFAVKHVISSFLGWLIILTLSLFAAKVFSWRCAFFFSLFLFCTPRFVGYTFGNFNDTLFALAFYFTLVEIWMFCLDFPLIKWSRLALICVGMIVATTTSVSGFSLVFFLLLFSLLYFFVKNPIRHFFTKKYWMALLTLVMIFIGMVAVVLLFNIIFSAGFSFLQIQESNDLLSLFVATSSQTPQFFGGKIVGVGQTPSDYVLTYLFITIPFMVIVGVLFTLAFFRTFLKEFSLFIIFVFVITFFYMLSSFSTPYVGSDIICTLVFMLSPLVVMYAAMGYEAVLKRVDDRYTNGIIVALALFLTCLPLRHVVFNKPLTLCYFNEISGGIHHAASLYPLDVNMQSAKVAEKWFSHYCEAQQDSMTSVQLACQDSLLKQMDSAQIAELTPDFYRIHLDTISVCTNGSEAFRKALQDHNPGMKVSYAAIHTLKSLPADYYILFGNSTALFGHTDEAFHTIDLERIPIVSIFKKEEIVDTLGNTLSFTSSFNQSEEIIIERK